MNMNKFNWRTDLYASFINLDHRTDRLSHMQSQLSRVGIDAVRTRGKLPNEFNLDDPKLQVMKNYNPRAIGCHFGHIEVLTKALEANKCPFIMEDDIVFCEDFSERMDIIQEFLNKQDDWDVFWLGGTYHIEPTWHRSVNSVHTHPDLLMCHCDKNADWEPTDNSKIRRTYGCWSTHAYIVNIKNLQKILSLLDEYVGSMTIIDKLFILLEPQLKTFAFVPGCVKQMDNISDLGGESNLMSYFSCFSALGSHWYADKMQERRIYMEQFAPHINIDYPPNNTLIFEEWFYQNYNAADNKSEYDYLPVFWTSYHVNNSYGNDPVKRRELQNYIDSLDRSKKYFTILQYDDGCLVDFKDLNIRVFGASGKDATDNIPLLSKPQSFLFNTDRNIFASFVGSPTHGVRDSVLRIDNNDRYYIVDSSKRHPTSGGSTWCRQIFTKTQHSIEEYCGILSRSIFSLCPRGYGINSFRIAESVQYGAIPVYISDEFSIPKWMNFEEFGVIIKDGEDICEKINSLSSEEIKKKQLILGNIYNRYYTYESNYKLILNSLLK